MKWTWGLVGLALTCGVAQAAAPLSREQFRKDVAGKKLSSVNSRGKAFVVVFQGDGGGTFTYPADNQAMPIRWYYSAGNLCWGVPAFKTVDECNIVTAEGGDLVFTDVSKRKLNNRYQVAP